MNRQEQISIERWLKSRNTKYNSNSLNLASDHVDDYKPFKTKVVYYLPAIID